SFQDVKQERVYLPAADVSPPLEQDRVDPPGESQLLPGQPGFLLDLSNSMCQGLDAFGEIAGNDVPLVRVARHGGSPQQQADTARAPQEAGDELDERAGSLRAVLLPTPADAFRERSAVQPFGLLAQQARRHAFEVAGRDRSGHEQERLTAGFVVEVRPAGAGPGSDRLRSFCRSRAAPYADDRQETRQRRDSVEMRVRHTLAGDAV